jgi:hypothetical protein
MEHYFYPVTGQASLRKSACENNYCGATLWPDEEDDAWSL